MVSETIMELFWKTDQLIKTIELSVLEIQKEIDHLMDILDEEETGSP